MNSKKSAGLPVDKLSVRVNEEAHCGNGEGKTTTLALKECTIKEQQHSSGAENRLIAERYRRSLWHDNAAAIMGYSTRHGCSKALTSGGALAIGMRNDNAAAIMGYSTRHGCSEALTSGPFWR
ncbi:hypothetical protein ACLEC2_15140 [Lonsdalea quercina]|uniref:hypothetical protein n=1 Tax=Lonsdalea quercina TaxID=71657 RepID=UPI0039766466